MAFPITRKAVNDRLLPYRENSSDRISQFTTDNRRFQQNAYNEKAYSESYDKMSQFTTDDHKIQQNADLRTVQPQPLQRYWLRTFSLIVIPPIITAWYGIIFVHYVVDVKNDDAVKYRTFSGSVIYYSWFIIGVFGLTWAQYGLRGVEVAMLQTPFWKASNLVATLMHANTTWSSPSGWCKAIYHREFHRLWSLLMLVFILPFIAFPLSGLVFDIGDGYIKTSEHPFVAGRNTTTYNNQTVEGSGPIDETATLNAWKVGLTPTIPGFGVAYTAPEIDRPVHSCLKKVPNTLPLTETIPDMFLAPQADVPVSGETWGLRVKYDCSIVQEASEFTILSEKPESIFSGVDGDSIYTYVDGDPNSVWPVVTLRTPSGSAIQIFNSSLVPENDMGMWSYSEMGTSVLPKSSSVMTYENRSDDKYNVHVDISQSIVLEYALWQLQFRAFYDKANENLPFNSTLGPVIEGMGSPFFLSANESLENNSTFFKIRQGENFTLTEPGGAQVTLDASVTDLRNYFNPSPLTNYHFMNSESTEITNPILSVAAPVGVRCIVSSGAGTATVDGVTSTFSNFSRLDPERNLQGYTGGVFGLEAQKLLARTKFSDFYRTGHLPGLLQQGAGLGRYQGYIPSTALLNSVLRAYGMDAIQRMYGLTPGFEVDWEDTGLTSSEEGKIINIGRLIPGPMAGYVVLGLFCAWSVLSIALGIFYGFKKRPSDRLDGYSMLRAGADMSDALKNNDEFLSGESFYDNKTFRALPGR